MAHKLNPLKVWRAASCSRHACAVRSNSQAIGASPNRWRAWAMALLLTNVASLGNTRSRLSTTSLIDQWR
eukprot:26520-Eustigmatos_ZCMA.PRE.1